MLMRNFVVIDAIVPNINIDCMSFLKVLKGIRTLFCKVLSKHVENFQPCVAVLTI